MKTLDEVIDYAQMIVPMTSAPDTKDMWSSIEYYLKEYQRYQNTPSCNGHMALVDYFEESQKNEPLTWDELKQMEGKPVWVEHIYYKVWLIVKDVYEETIVLDGNGFYTQYFSDDNEKGTRWQAYRKERTE